MSESQPNGLAEQSDKERETGALEAAEPEKVPDQEIVERLEPFVIPERASEAALVVESMLIQQSHSGPLPTAREYRGYEAVLPGAADRILTLAELEQKHRHGLETEVVKSEFKLKGRGQMMAMAALVFMLAVSFGIVLLGHPTAGVTFGTAIIVAVIAIFHGQKWYPQGGQPKEETSKQE